MFPLWIQLKVLARRCSTLSIRSWERSLTAWKRTRLTHLQNRETVLAEQLAMNRHRQVEILNHPLMERSRQQELKAMEMNLQGQHRPRFDLHHLL